MATESKPRITIAEVERRITRLENLNTDAAVARHVHLVSMLIPFATRVKFLNNDPLWNEASARDDVFENMRQCYWHLTQSQVNAILYENPGIGLSGIFCEKDLLLMGWVREALDHYRGRTGTERLKP